MNLDHRLSGLPAFHRSIDFVSPMKAIPTLLLRWYKRIEERRQLLEMSDELLRDVGLSRDQVRREAAKPFWLE